MNLYSKKQRWKLFLFSLAVIIVGGSFWYTGQIAGKIRAEERQKVRLWSKAIQKRAKLVNYTKTLFQRLREEEREKVELWAEATRILAHSDQVANYSFVLKVVQNNTTVPVILTDSEDKIITSRNLPEQKSKDSTYLRKQIREMKAAYDPIEIQFSSGDQQYLYYKDSKLFSELQKVMDDLISSFISETVVNTASVPVILTDSSREQVIAHGNVDSFIVQDQDRALAKIREMRAQNEPIKVELGDDPHYIFYEESWVLTQLRYFPYVQLGVIGLFLIIAYFLFSTFRKAEQNQVWLGLAKETAHQLGTPLSSLMAWLELLKAKDMEDETIHELQKDVDRLSTITDRFSKIGSDPELIREDVRESLEEVVAYLRSRISRKVKIDLEGEEDKHLRARINKALFGWVVENICKNAVDAMEGEGTISIKIVEEGDQVHIDIKDTGKGMPKSQQKSVFQPGFTSKKHGWGLGLSLSKRIIENYHGGKIFVKQAEPGKGTTFRISLWK